MHHVCLGEVRGEQIVDVGREAGEAHIVPNEAMDVDQQKCSP